MKHFLVVFCSFAAFCQICIGGEDSSSQEDGPNDALKQLEKNVSSLWTYISGVRQKVEHDLHQLHQHQKEVTSKLKSMFDIDLEQGDGHMHHMDQDEHQYSPSDDNDHKEGHHDDDHHNEHHSKHHHGEDHSHDHGDHHNGHHDDHHDGHHDDHHDDHHDGHHDEHHNDHHDEHHDDHHDEHHDDHHDGHHSEHHDGEGHNDEAHHDDHHSHHSEQHHDRPDHGHDNDHTHDTTCHNYPHESKDGSYDHHGHQHDHDDSGDVHKSESNNDSDCHTLDDNSVDNASNNINITHTTESHHKQHHHKESHQGHHRHQEQSHHHHHHGHHHSHHSSHKYSSNYDFAVCIVAPNTAIPPEKQQNITGKISLWQKKNGTTLHIHIKVKGFKMDNHGHHAHTEHQPGEDLPINHSHGIHIHRDGNLSSSCQSTGPHFNPTDVQHGGPSSPVRHVGDLGNIECNEHGVTNVIITDEVASLHGENAIIGKSIVIHERKDDLGTNPDNPASLSSGDAGSRVACCVIKKINRLSIGHTQHGHHRH